MSGSYHTTRNDTDANADVRCRHVPKWSKLLCVAKTMASTSSRVFKGQTKSPIYALEENGHLQHLLFNVMPPIVKGVRGPHGLGDYCASVRDSAVKKPIGGVEWLCLGVQSNRTNKEEVSFSVGIGRSFDRWDGVTLQQVEKIFLSLTRQESLGNVAIDEERLRGMVRWGRETEVGFLTLTVVYILWWKTVTGVRLWHVLFVAHSRRLYT